MHVCISITAKSYPTPIYYAVQPSLARLEYLFPTRKQALWWGLMRHFLFVIRVVQVERNGVIPCKSEWTGYVITIARRKPRRHDFPAVSLQVVQTKGESAAFSHWRRNPSFLFFFERGLQRRSVGPILSQSRLLAE